MRYTTHSGTSVIIPVKNGEPTIGRALASIAYQTLGPDEVIIVENGSTDRTIEVAEQWRDRLPIKIVNCDTPGSAAARNVGILESSFQKLAFLDADDVWYPEKLRIQSRLIDEIECEFTGTYMNYVAINGRVLGNNVRYKDSAEAQRALRSGHAMPVPLSSVIVTRSIIDKVGLFDETFNRAQDFEWLARVAAVTALEIPSKAPQVGYLLSGGSSTSDSYVEQGLAADLVRKRIRGEAAGDTYRSFVLEAARERRVPPRLRAGQAYRRAGVHVSQHEFLKGGCCLSFALFLNPAETMKKLLWQSTFTKSQKLDPKVMRIFLEAND